MASMQCYREETCQTKCYDNSFGQKVSDGTVLHGNHRTSNHGGCFYGQSNGGHQHRSDHQAMSETQTYYSQTQTYYPDQYAVGKTQSPHCMNQSGYGAMGKTQSSPCMSQSGIGGSGHGHHMGQQMAHGTVSGGCHEKKMMSKCELEKKKMMNKCELKKKKNHLSRKHKDGNGSRSESESDSHCD